MNPPSDGFTWEPPLRRWLFTIREAVIGPLSSQIKYKHNSYSRNPTVDYNEIDV